MVYFAAWLGSHPIVGMTNSASDRAPVGQRVVMVLSRV